jgi:hypothetical protein
MLLLAPGDPCEFKIGSRWLPAQLVSYDGLGIYQAECRGSLYSTQASNLRAPRYKASADPERLARKKAQSVERKQRVAPVKAERTRANPHRCESYLRMVREHGCLVCASPGPVDAHHQGPHGTGLKASDFHAVPLCRRCHQYWHQHGHLPGLDVVNDRSAHDRSIAIFDEVKVRLLVRWSAGDKARAVSNGVRNDEDSSVVE